MTDDSDLQYPDPSNSDGLERSYADDSFSTAPDISSAPLLPDDEGARADLARGSRLDRFRTERQSQFSMAIPALLLVVLGAIFLIDVFTPDQVLLSPPLALGLITLVVGLAFVGRYLANGRKETGLLLVGLVCIVSVALSAAFGFQIFDLAAGYPLIIAAIGVVFILMIFFGARERGLLLPGLAITVAGVAMLPFSIGLLPARWIELIKNYYPALLIVLAVLLLPRAFRGRAR